MPSSLIEVQIGQNYDYLCGNTRHAVYIGTDRRLHHKTALVQDSTRPYEVLAQFDDVAIGYGFGWWPFGTRDFAVDIEPPL